MLINIRSLTAALLVASVPLAAQGRANCARDSAANAPHPVWFVRDMKVNGPGDAFGITAYTCTSCQIKSTGGLSSEITFYTEPVVTGTAPTSPVKEGDVIEAVNGQPITTAAGGNLFVNPFARYALTLTVRRGRESLTLTFEAFIARPYGYTTSLRARRAPCTDSSSRSPSSAGPFGFPDSTSWSFSRGGMRGGRSGVSVNWMDRPPLPATRFGFALECVADCPTKYNYSADGATDVSYLKYEAPPRVSAVLTGSPAASSGLRVGDVLIKVDGKSITDDESSLKLFRTLPNESLSLTVLRDGKEITMRLQVPK